MRIGKVDRRVLAALSQTPQVSAATRKAANEVRKRARQRAPRRTGALRRSLTVQRERDITTKAWSYKVGWDKRVAFYGALVELGTERARAQPHLRPAADEVNRMKGTR